MVTGDVLRPDQTLKRHSDAWNGDSTTSHLGFQPVQKAPTIHAGSEFIRRIPAEIVLTGDATLHRPHQRVNTKGGDP